MSWVIETGMSQSDYIDPQIDRQVDPHKKKYKRERNRATIYLGTTTICLIGHLDCLEM